MESIEYLPRKQGVRYIISLSVEVRVPAEDWSTNAAALCNEERAIWTCLGAGASRIAARKRSDGNEGSEKCSEHVGRVFG